MEGQAPASIPVAIPAASAPQDSRKVELGVSPCGPPITGVRANDPVRPLSALYDSLEWGVALAWAWHQDVLASATNRSTSSTLVANEVTSRPTAPSPSTLPSSPT